MTTAEAGAGNPDRTSQGVRESEVLASGMIVILTELGSLSPMTILVFVTGLRSQI